MIEAKKVAESIKSSQNVTELPVLNIGKIQESLLEDEQMVSRIDRRWGSWEVSG